MEEVTEVEMIGWHQQLNGHESEQTPGESDGQTWHIAVHGVAKRKTQQSD